MVLRRLCRVLSETDKKALDDLLNPYIKASSHEKYCYELNDEQVPNKLIELAKIYPPLCDKLPDTLKEKQAFKLFERVYYEQFTLDDKGKTHVKKASKMNSSSLQSPDDLDATYRCKRGEGFKGQVANVTETADPENDFNLITDICGENNNVNDNTIITDRIDGIKEKTPDLNELHVDNVTCPGQNVRAAKTSKPYKAVFDPRSCGQCPLREQCKSTKMKKGQAYYFTSRNR